MVATQIATQHSTVVSSTVEYIQSDSTGAVIIAAGTGTPPTTASVFQVGCIFYKTDASSGTGVFVNAGTTAVPVWVPFTSAMLPSPNFVSDNSNGATNAICVSLFTVGTVKATITTGTRVAIKLTHTLQKNGTNTLNINGTTKNLVSSVNPANNIGTAFAVGGIVEVIYTPGVTSSGVYQVLGH